MDTTRQMNTLVDIRHSTRYNNVDMRKPIFSGRSNQIFVLGVDSEWMATAVAVSGHVPVRIDKSKKATSFCDGVIIHHQDYESFSLTPEQILCVYHHQKCIPLIDDGKLMQGERFPFNRDDRIDRFIFIDDCVDSWLPLLLNRLLSRTASRWITYGIGDEIILIDKYQSCSFSSSSLLKEQTLVQMKMGESEILVQLLESKNLVSDLSDIGYKLNTIRQRIKRMKPKLSMLNLTISRQRLQKQSNQWVWSLGLKEG